MEKYSCRKEENGSVVYGKNNNEPERAENVGPSLSKDNFKYYDNLEIDIFGELFIETHILEDYYDNDYYKFSLFGKADIELSILNYPCNYSVELWFYDNADYGYKKFSCSFGGYGDTKRKDIKIEGMPGNYWIRVFSPDKDISEEEDNCLYQVKLKATYTNGKINQSFSNLLFDKGVHAVAWISDFDPLNYKAFESVESQSKKFFHYEENYLLESSLYKYGKILQSSLFLTGFKDKVKDKLLFCLQDIHDSVDLNNNEASYVKVDSIVVTGAEIILSVIFFNPHSQILTTASLIYNAFELGMQIGEFFDLASFMQSAIPCNEKLNKESFKKFLERLMDDIRIASFESVIRINYYYSLSQGPGNTFDTRSIAITVDYQYEIKTYRDYSDIDTISSKQEGSYFRGRLYPIKSKDDMDKAKNHRYVTYLSENTSQDMTIQDENPYYLHEGEYHWYKFVAPKTANYHFYSKKNPDFNLDPCGELCTRIYDGQSTIRDCLASDDNSLGNKDFEFFYNLLQGQTVYIRIHGVGFKTHGYYSLHAETFSDSPLKVKHISKNDLGFPCSYGGTTSSTKEISYSDGSKAYIKSSRCGTVKDDNNNYFLTLSCLKTGVHEAYIWFSFDKPILRFLFDVSLWGSVEKIADGKADFTIGVSDSKDSKFRFSAELYTAYAIDDLSKNRYKLETKGLSFKEQDHIYGVMVNIRTNIDTTSTRNLGRLVLDNFYFGF
ncbi:MAG: hypothetical protein J6T15_07245 [Bacilli bacterium]|nr:hypothetical protein [Bacilli bacterium]